MPRRNQSAGVLGDSPEVWLYLFKRGHRVACSFGERGKQRERLERELLTSEGGEAVVERCCFNREVAFELFERLGDRP